MMRPTPPPLPSPPPIEAPFPVGRNKTQAVSAFQKIVDQGHFSYIKRRLCARPSRKVALAKWKAVREQNPTLTDADIRKMQRQEAAEKKKQTREELRRLGVSTKGTLLAKHSWRKLDMGDQSAWTHKLSFIPVAQVRPFGEKNLDKLRSVHKRLVDVVRLRGGTKTTQHQTGQSVGVTVAPGGRRPSDPQESNPERYSGTIQLKKFNNPEMQRLQEDLITTVTACIEEAFGCLLWYRAVKEAFEKVPGNRRLPNCPLPVSNIWWNWNVNKSTAHIDSNTISPCFVFTPYTYHGAELLCGAGNLKIPMHAGEIIGGSWQRFPHCSDTLWSGERYSFVAYFDYRMLQDTYWIR